MTDRPTPIEVVESSLYDLMRELTDQRDRAVRALRDPTADYEGRLRDEVRRLQAMLDQAVDGDLSCEDICLVVCAGPCEGRPFGSSQNAGSETR